MENHDEPIAGLMNIGSTIAQRLKAVGIHTKRDLQSVGPVTAYRRIRQQNPSQTIPVCYYLYSLQGALLGIHWDDLAADVKDTLRREANVAEPDAAPDRGGTKASRSTRSPRRRGR